MKLFGAGTESLPSEGRLADFDGATGWLNSQPLTAEGLRGKVVLVDFWTYTCINWLRTLACVRAWSEQVRGATAWSSSACTRPSSRSSATSTTCAGRSRRWTSATRSRSTPTTRSGRRSPTTTGRPPTSPTREGQIRHHHFGEGGYDEQERVDPAAARRRGRARALVEPPGFEVQADWENLESPETYLGYEQARTRPERARRAALRPELSLNQWSLEGDWTVERRAVRARRRRRPARVPLPRPRRPARDGAARARDAGAVPRAARRRAAGRGARARRRRGGPGRGERAAPPPADPPAGRDRATGRSSSSFPTRGVEAYCFTFG